jgi:beta-1,4-mannosyl-glycoprotein beta-1,4-N-acetylglucosaminyltransferase
MSVIDAITYSGEADLLELRLNILDPYVDLFVIAESAITFSGKQKPLYFKDNAQRFSRFLPKILYAEIKDFYDPQILTYLLPQCEDMNYPHKMAFYQKEYLQLAFAGLKDDDTIYYGDCDEIWTPQEVQEEPAKLEQLSYTMYLNNRSTEPWKGTAIATYAKVKQYGLNQIRLKAEITHPNGGWHFTNQGGLDALTRKIQSYDHQEVNTPEVHAKLKERFEKGEDFLGRNIQTWKDESDWPQYLKQHKATYQHLCLQ